jgi:membrane fusion protein (multidrug efflux system)
MFARVAVLLPKRRDVVAIPAPAVLHASYGDSVFVVEEKKDDAGRPVVGKDGKPVKVGRQQFVKIGEMQGDLVAVIAGVTAGQEIVSAGGFKLRNGSVVVVDNRVQPKPENAPAPANR